MQTQLPFNYSEQNLINQIKQAWRENELQSILLKNKSAVNDFYQDAPQFSVAVNPSNLVDYPTLGERFAMDSAYDYKDKCVSRIITNKNDVIPYNNLVHNYEWTTAAVQRENQETNEGNIQPEYSTIKSYSLNQYSDHIKRGQADYSVPTNHLLYRPLYAGQRSFQPPDFVQQFIQQHLEEPEQVPKEIDQNIKQTIKPKYPMKLTLEKPEQKKPEEPEKICAVFEEHKEKFDNFQNKKEKSLKRDHLNPQKKVQFKTQIQYPSLQTKKQNKRTQSLEKTAKRGAKKMSQKNKQQQQIQEEKNEQNQNQIYQQQQQMAQQTQQPQDPKIKIQIRNIQTQTSPKTQETDYILQQDSQQLFQSQQQEQFRHQQSDTPAFNQSEKAHFRDTFSSQQSWEPQKESDFNIQELQGEAEQKQKKKQKKLKQSSGSKGSNESSQNNSNLMLSSSNQQQIKVENYQNRENSMEFSESEAGSQPPSSPIQENYQDEINYRTSGEAYQSKELNPDSIDSPFYLSSKFQQSQKFQEDAKKSIEELENLLSQQQKYLQELGYLPSDGILTSSSELKNSSGANKQYMSFEELDREIEAIKQELRESQDQQIEQLRESAGSPLSDTLYSISEEDTEN